MPFQKREVNNDETGPNADAFLKHPSSHTPGCIHSVRNNHDKDYDASRTRAKTKSKSRMFIMCRVVFFFFDQLSELAPFNPTRAKRTPTTTTATTTTTTTTTTTIATTTTTTSTTASTELTGAYDQNYLVNVFKISLSLSLAEPLQPQSSQTHQVSHSKLLSQTWNRARTARNGAEDLTLRVGLMGDGGAQPPGKAKLEHEQRDL